MHFKFVYLFNLLDLWSPVWLPCVLYTQCASVWVGMTMHTRLYIRMCVLRVFSCLYLCSIYSYLYSIYNYLYSIYSYIVLLSNANTLKKHLTRIALKVCNLAKLFYFASAPCWCFILVIFVLLFTML